MGSSSTSQVCGICPQERGFPETRGTRIFPGALREQLLREAVCHQPTLRSCRAHHAFLDLCPVSELELPGPNDHRRGAPVL